jgi:hypothetical protein
MQRTMVAVCSTEQVREIAAAMMLLVAGPEPLVDT